MLQGCSTGQLVLNLELLLLIHLKIDIYKFVPSTEPFLSNIRELVNKFFQISNSTSTTGKIPTFFYHTNSTQAHKCIVNNGTHFV